MALFLQCLDQQPFGAFDRDAVRRPMPASRSMSARRATDVVGELALIEQSACRVQDAQLVMGVAPVQSDEHSVNSSRFDL